MNEQALIDMMEALKEFDNYSYHRKDMTFQFKNLTSKQMVRLLTIINTHNLKCELEYGEFVIWLRD
jgi:hypothetical protein